MMLKLGCGQSIQTKIKTMTVAELIEKLKEMPQDYTVTASLQDDLHSYEVTDVYEHHEAFREVELS